MNVEPVVWIIDREQWPRACLRAELIERGYDAVGFIEIDRALALLERTRARRPQAIVLELRGQPPGAARDALARSGVPVIATGGAVELGEAAQRGFTAVLPRPVTLGEIADAVEKIVPRS